MPHSVAAGGSPAELDRLKTGPTGNMPRIVIDNREVDVPAGTTLLDAARRVGIDVPTLCWHEGFRPNTSCMVCVVKVGQRDGGPGRASGRLVPSCATLAEDGMRVESETDEVRQVRRAMLELLLSDHVGECRAPCQHACPFDTDVPRMFEQVAGGRLDEAIVTLRKAVPLPAVLGRVSREVCETACRRSAVDESASIGLLKRYVADKDLASGDPYVPPCDPSSGKRVAVVGSGPAGLSAAYFLLQAGHTCALFETRDKPGGTLCDLAEEQLPREVLAAEIAMIEHLGGRFELSTTVGRQPALTDLWRGFDAVLVAVGRLDAGRDEVLGLAISEGCLRVDRTTHETGEPGVFAAGDVVQPRGEAVRAAAAGKTAAVCIDQYLRDDPVVGRRKLVALRMGRPRPETFAIKAARAGPTQRVIPSDGPGTGLTDSEARVEAQRCLRCDCRKLDKCRLQKFAEMYGADGGRYRGQRREVEKPTGHPDVVYEPGKCILCGLCIQVAEQAGEPLGLTYVGRGFDVYVGVPFDESLDQALTIAARRCVEVCPTGALAWRLA